MKDRQTNTIVEVCKATDQKEKAVARRHVRGKLRSSAFRRGFDHPSIISQSSFAVTWRKKKNRVLQGYCGTAYAVPCQGNQYQPKLGLAYPKKSI